LQRRSGIVSEITETPTRSQARTAIFQPPPLPPPAPIRICGSDCAGSPAAKRLRAAAKERMEISSAAQRLSRTHAAERWGRSQAAKGRSQRVRRNPTKQSSFDQHSRLCVAIERLFSVGINALERRLDGSEARLDASG
jgi:hypothetical protein